MQNRPKFKKHHILTQMRMNARDAVERGEDPRVDARPLLRRVFIEEYQKLAYPLGEARRRAEAMTDRYYDRIGFSMTDEEYFATLEDISSLTHASGVIDTAFDEDGHEEYPYALAV